MAHLGLSWGSLGTLLGHLRTIVGPRVFRNLWPDLLVPGSKRLGQFWDSFRDPKFGLDFGRYFGRLGLFCGPILGPDRPKRDQDGSKRAIKSFKVLKTCICKHLKTLYVFQGVWGSRPYNTASEGPGRLPRGTRGPYQNIMGQF